MKTILFLTFLFIAVLFGAHDLIAQPPPPALPSDVTQAPIDGGLSILAAAGAGYSAYRLRKKNK